MNRQSPPQNRSNRTRIWMPISLAAAMLFNLPSQAQETSPPSPAELQRTAATIAMNRGLDWLASIQQESGAWSNADFPALTAMPLWAMIRSGRTDLAPAISKATTYLLNCVKHSGPDKGAIYVHVPDRKGGGLPNYNTALAVIALHALQSSPLLDDVKAQTEIPNLIPVILHARAFLAAAQNKGESVHFGGMGYDPPTGRDYADLSNSYLAYESMYLTRDIEELRPGNQRVSLDWEAARQFIQRIQNLPQYNDQPWASDDPAEVGGFAYRPDTYREEFGAFTNQNGVLQYRSALTMSYAGLASYLYSGLDAEDPRVQAVLDWITSNWTVDISNRNPDLAGQPEQMGAFYYYLNVLTRALDTLGIDTISTSESESVAWRQEVLAKILLKQGIDGSWVNEYGRYWEADPVLSSAFALLALQNALGL